jgi:hypothetical protein
MVNLHPAGNRSIQPLVLVSVRSDTPPVYREPSVPVLASISEPIPATSVLDIAKLEASIRRQQSHYTGCKHREHNYLASVAIAPFLLPAIIRAAAPFARAARAAALRSAADIRVAAGRLDIHLIFAA